MRDEEKTEGQNQDSWGLPLTGHVTGSEGFADFWTLCFISSKL